MTTGAPAQPPAPVDLDAAAQAVVAQAPPLSQQQKDALRLAWRGPRPVERKAS